jgi:hypothetical protein
VKSPGTRLGGAQCRRSREFLPPGRDLRPAGPSFGNSNPAGGGKRPRTGRRFHTASERDIPHYKDKIIPHFDGVLTPQIFFLTDRTTLGMIWLSGGISMQTGICDPIAIIRIIIIRGHICP